MPDNYSNYADAARGRQQYSDMPLESSGPLQSLPPTTEGLAGAYSMIGSGAGYSGGNSSPYAGAMQAMQSIYGNRAMQRYMGQNPGQGQGQGMSGYVGGMAGDQGTSTISGLGGSFVMPGQPVSGGTMPSTGGNDTYGYWHNNPSQAIIPGLPFGVPLPDYDVGFGADLNGMPLLSGQGDLGTWENGDGSARYGARGSIGLLPDVQMGPINGALLSAGAEASIGNDGFTLGAGFTTGGFGGSTGDKFDGNVHNEDSVNVGMAGGDGAAIRGHWGDSDGDKYREYGFGVDVGPFSFDVKSEDPLRTVLNGFPILPIPGSPTPASFFNEKSNLTEGAIDMAGSAASTVAGWGTSVMDTISPLWMGESGGLDPAPGATLGGDVGSLFSSFL